MYSVNGIYYNKVIENFTGTKKYNGESCSSSGECMSNFCAYGLGPDYKC
jgi:hypothetical protein